MRNRKRWFLVAFLLLFACCPPVVVIALSADTPPQQLDSTVNLTTSAVAPLGKLTTLTSKPHSICPSPTIKLPPKLPLPSQHPNFAEFYGGFLQDYLNIRGSPQGLQNALNKLIGTPAAQAQVIIMTITGHETPDILILFPFLVPGQDVEGAIFLFTCQDSLYVLADAMNIYSLSPGPAPHIDAVTDMNGDGLPELVYSATFNIGNHGDWDVLYKILEWNGQHLVNLIAAPDYGFLNDADPITVDGDSTVRRVEGDGTLSLVLTSHMGVTSWARPDSSVFARNPQATWSWNGTAFILTCVVRFEAPVFRVQAAEDGDANTKCGRYEQALQAYQRVIFDNTLVGWNTQRSDSPPNPADLSIPPIPDVSERIRLKAYALYRIMLVDILRAERPKAQDVYQTLSHLYPVGTLGHEWVNVATMFWDNYHLYNNIGLACKQVVTYARDHQAEVMSPLGQPFYHGYSLFSPDFAGDKPTIICPF